MMTELPAYVLDCFTLERGALHWTDAASWRASVERWRSVRPDIARRMGAKKIPFLSPCGFINVAGRGALVRFGGLNLLECDLRHALAVTGGALPWDCGAWPPDPVMPPAARAVIASTWALDGARVVWRESVHETRPAGTVAAGREVFGRSDAVLTRRGVGYLASDVRRVLDW